MTPATTMRIHLVPPSRTGEPYDPLWEDFLIVQRSARLAGSDHEAVADPDAADVLLFLGSRDALHRDLRRHPLARRYRDRVRVYDSSDWVIPFFPGIYPSLAARYYNARRTRSGFFLRYSDSEAVRWEPWSATRFLFSFVGAGVTHPVRDRILRLPSERAMLRDTSQEPGRGYGQEPAVYASYKRAYGDSLGASKFVLCPRGVGTGSIRVFEVMKAGRVPVIISDQWVEPTGPDWSGFSIRVAERDVDTLPEALAAREGHAEEMGARARREWEHWFAPSSAFTTLATWCRELAVDGIREQIARRAVLMQLLRPRYLRHCALSPLARRLGLRRGRR